nr:MAG TPA: hypothetical protein [Caudoviricetes sp.]
MYCNILCITRIYYIYGAIYENISFRKNQKKKRPLLGLLFSQQVSWIVIQDTAVFDRQGIYPIDHLFIIKFNDNERVCLTQLSFN